MDTPFPLTFKQLRAYADSHNIEIEREGKGYAYWQRSNGGATVGHADTLREAFDDLKQFMLK